MFLLENILKLQHKTQSFQEHFGVTVEFREYQAQVKQHMEEEFSPSSTGSGVW